MVLQFSHIEVIEHPLICDTTYNSSTGQEGLFDEDGGPLLQLSWDHKATTIVDIDVYEVTRHRRRNGCELRLSSEQRTQLLLENGYTQNEIDLRSQKRQPKHLRKQSLFECRDSRWMSSSPSLSPTRQEEEGKNRKLSINAVDMNKIVSATSKMMIYSPTTSGMVGAPLSRKTTAAKSA